MKLGLHYRYWIFLRMLALLINGFIKRPPPLLIFRQRFNHRMLSDQPQTLGKSKAPTSCVCVRVFVFASTTSRDCWRERGHLAYPSISVPFSPKLIRQRFLLRSSPLISSSSILPYLFSLLVPCSSGYLKCRLHCSETLLITLSSLDSWLRQVLDQLSEEVGGHQR